MIRQRKRVYTLMLAVCFTLARAYENISSDVAKELNGHAECQIHVNADNIDKKNPFSSMQNVRELFLFFLFLIHGFFLALKLAGVRGPIKNVPH